MKSELLDDVLTGKRQIAKVMHACTGVNPPVEVTFLDGSTVCVTDKEAKELLRASDHSDLNLDDLLASLD